MVACSLLLDRKVFNDGVLYRIRLPFEQHAHMLVTGQTGSGKSHFLQLLFGHIFIAYRGRAQLVLMDAKGDDAFSSYMKLPNFYMGDDVKDGWMVALERFDARRQGNESKELPLFIVLDDFAGWLFTLPKKEQEEVKQQMARILMQGRSFQVHLIVGLQRGDASLFSTGSRDNFGIRLLLGAASKESQRMMLDTDCADLEPLGRGEGYLQIADGTQPKQVLVPPISKPELLEKAIVRFLSR